MDKFHKLKEPFIMFFGWAIFLIVLASLFLVKFEKSSWLVFILIASLLFIYNFFIFFIYNKRKKSIKKSAGKNVKLIDSIKILKNENIKLQEKIKNTTSSLSNEKASLLWNLSIALTRDLDLKTLLYTTITKIDDLIGYHAAAAFLYNSDRTDLFMACHDGLFEDEIKLNLRPDIGIPNIVVKKGKLLFIPDTTKDPRFQEITRTAPIHSALYVPIELESEIFGVICLWNRDFNKYNKEDFSLLKMISQAAARSVKNAELYKELDTRLNFIVTLWETSKSLTSSLSISSSWEKVLTEALKSISYLFRANQAIFFQYQKDSMELIPHITWNISEKFKKELYSDLKRDPIMYWQHLKTHFQTREITEDPQFSGLKKFIKKENIKSMLWSPLVGRDRVIGALCLFSSDYRLWKKEEIQWLDIFANFFGMTLENVTLLYDLLSEKNQLQTLIDNVPEGVFTTNPEGIVLTWNKAAEAITGYSSVEAIGKNGCEILRISQKEKVSNKKDCVITKALNQKKKIDSGFNGIFISHKNKNSIPVFITAVPISEQNNMFGVIVVFRDITKEKEIENMKEDFLATVTHDLKSPLASIMGYTELILNPKLGPLNSEQREFGDAVLRSSKILQILINNVLESTKMGAGIINLNPILFKLKVLLDEIEEMFRPLLSHKSLKFRVIVEPSTMVFGDREKIREVLINLINNSIKFTPEKGTISILTKVVNNKVAIGVSDTGKGIPKESIGKLFRKFTQVKGQKKGTGLGLYICKKILQAHNQVIKVKSKVGQGSTFMFMLDMTKPSSLKSQRNNILFIGSEPLLIQNFKNCFRGNNFVIDSVSSWPEIEIMLNGKVIPGLFILDWNIPNRESYRIYHKIRNEHRVKDVPLMVLCKNKDEIDTQCDTIIRKPVDLEELFIKTKALIKSR